MCRSPNGKQVAYISSLEYSDANSRKTKGILRMNKDGTRKWKVVMFSDLEPKTFSWSPDGTQIAFVAYNNRTDKTGLYIADATNI